MTTIRWILSYTLPTLLVAVLISSYFYWDEIKGQYKEISWPVPQVEQWLAKWQEEEPSNGIKQGSHKNNVGFVQASNSYAVHRQGLYPTPMRKMNPSSPVWPENSMITKPVQFQHAQPLQQFNPPKYRQVAKPEIDKKTFEQLKQARMLFWKGDLEQAEKQYIEIINNQKDIADIYGELANIQFQMATPENNKKQAAINNLYAAGELLINQYDVPRSKQLIKLLAFIDPDKAQALNEVGRVNWDR